MDKIVVVEDELALLNNILQILRFEDFQVFSADNGVAGIEAVREHHPDLILCDIMLPEMDGYEVLQVLRHDLSTAFIPFIFLTARDSRDDIRRGMELGADDYISKPFSSRELVSAIHTRLKRRKDTEHQRMRALSHHLYQLQENERQLFAHQLKDKINNPLIGLKVLLNVSKRLPEETLRTRLDEARILVDDVLSQVVTISQKLNPALLDDLGLLPALVQHIKQFSAHTQIDVTFQHTNLDRRLPPTIEITAFRIVEESLSNIALHTAVNEASVQIWVDENNLYLQIEDQGQGFHIETALNTETMSTLTGLYERVDLLGGEFTIVSAADIGTRVFTRIPLESEYPATPVAQTRTPSAASAAPRSPSATSTITIVLADTQDLTRKGLRSLLDDQPDFVILGEAATPQETLDRVDDLHPNLLVVDAAMGWETVQRVAQRAPDTRLLLLAVHAEEAYVLDALHKGVLGYVLKEASVDELAQAVRAVAAGRRYLSQTLSERAVEAYLNAQQTTVGEHDPLSNREREILELIVQGARTSAIANLLTISPRTVETHRANLMRKLGVRTQAELVRYALQHGIGT